MSNMKKEYFDFKKKHGKNILVKQTFEEYEIVKKVSKNHWIVKESFSNLPFAIVKEGKYWVRYGIYDKAMLEEIAYKRELLYYHIVAHYEISEKDQEILEKGGEVYVKLQQYKTK